MSCVGKTAEDIVQSLEEGSLTIDNTPAVLEVARLKAPLPTEVARLKAPPTTEDKNGDEIGEVVVNEQVLEGNKSCSDEDLEEGGNSDNAEAEIVEANSPQSTTKSCNASSKNSLESQRETERLSKKQHSGKQSSRRSQPKRKVHEVKRKLQVVRKEERRPVKRSKVKSSSTGGLAYKKDKQNKVGESAFPSGMDVYSTLASPAKKKDKQSDSSDESEMQTENEEETVARRQYRKFSNEEEESDEFKAPETEDDDDSEDDEVEHLPKSKSTPTRKTVLSTKANLVSSFVTSLTKSSGKKLQGETEDEDRKPAATNNTSVGNFVASLRKVSGSLLREGADYEDSDDGSEANRDVAEEVTEVVMDERFVVSNYPMKEMVVQHQHLIQAKKDWEKRNRGQKIGPVKFAEGFWIPYDPKCHEGVPDMIPVKFYWHMLACFQEAMRMNDEKYTALQESMKVVSTYQVHGGKLKLSDDEKKEVKKVTYAVIWKRVKVIPKEFKNDTASSKAVKETTKYIVDTVAKHLNIKDRNRVRMLKDNIISTVTEKLNEVKHNRLRQARKTIPKLMMLLSEFQQCHIEQVILPTLDELCLMGTLPGKKMKAQDMVIWGWMMFDFIPCVCPDWEYAINHGNKEAYLDKVMINDEKFALMSYDQYVDKWMVDFLVDTLEKMPTRFGKSVGWKYKTKNKKHLSIMSGKDNSAGKVNITITKEDQDKAEEIGLICKKRREEHRNHMMEWIKWAATSEYPIVSYNNVQLAQAYIDQQK